MAYLNALVTLLGMLTFIGIAVWAWSKGRTEANRDASLLPFALPDEGEIKAENKSGGSNE
ncbi:CcoQ/FixQ family Cbb3-type cytochrome c oxidase assembly chaperone [Paenalcaligenes niemegkensis]|uniref:cbb3-type cytochrome oxidase subunit 3 n=1 Tax=Paenalcaligenes niemegkensis TaxID=2895469 RepID=UPI001EE8B917|nr:CcoQ/FixQ family Cbb3-type cytochrome c oxidase assembly chaperone [Paenalcaligenes niemegkensis]MCQ9616762.1 CcoQ/FixQ family Cbb3-type cytochrome c oxidase assembly chaperone [Paenalcaligenes niemegkensis]